MEKKNDQPGSACTVYLTALLDKRRNIKESMVRELEFHPVLSTLLCEVRYQIELISIIAGNALDFFVLMLASGLTQIFDPLVCCHRLSSNHIHLQD
jgi:hypothetical protein